jgi:heme-degrading monooxygenase HmoA
VVPEKADQYLRHLRTETIPALKAISGFKGFSILRRVVKEGTEFLIITRWENLASIQQFAGIDHDAAVVPDSIKAIMVRYDNRVAHYTVTETF